MLNLSFTSLGEEGPSRSPYRTSPWATVEGNVASDTRGAARKPVQSIHVASVTLFPHNATRSHLGQATLELSPSCSSQMLPIQDSSESCVLTESSTNDPSWRRDKGHTINTYRALLQSICFQARHCAPQCAGAIATSVPDPIILDIHRLTSGAFLMSKLYFQT